MVVRKSGILHGNRGRGGMMTVVYEILSANPKGLSSTQIAELAAERTSPDGDGDGQDEAKAHYFRVKRAIDGMERLGYVNSLEHRRDGLVWVLNEEMIEQDVVAEAKQVIDDFKARMGKVIPASRESLLFEALKGVIKLEASRTETPAVRRKPLGVRKRKTS